MHKNNEILVYMYLKKVYFVYEQKNLKGEIVAFEHYRS
jgi:hypothetical protein